MQLGKLKLFLHNFSRTGQQRLQQRQQQHQRQQRQQQHQRQQRQQRQLRHQQQKRFKVLLRNRKTNKKSIGTFVEVQAAKKPTCIWQSGNPSLLSPLPGIVFDEESVPKYVYNTTLLLKSSTFTNLCPIGWALIILGFGKTNNFYHIVISLQIGSLKPHYSMTDKYWFWVEVGSLRSQVYKFRLLS